MCSVCCTSFSCMEEVGQMDAVLLREPQSLFKVPQRISTVFTAHLKSIGPLINYVIHINCSINQSNVQENISIIAYSNRSVRMKNK